jgi:hypothetical protein
MVRDNMNKGPKIDVVSGNDAALLLAALLGLGGPTLEQKAKAKKQREEYTKLLGEPMVLINTQDLLDTNFIDEENIEETKERQLELCFWKVSIQGKVVVRRHFRDKNGIVFNDKAVEDYMPMHIMALWKAWNNTTCIELSSKDS